MKKLITLLAVLTLSGCSYFAVPKEAPKSGDTKPSQESEATTENTKTEAKTEEKTEEVLDIKKIAEKALAKAQYKNTISLKNTSTITSDMGNGNQTSYNIEEIVEIDKENKLYHVNSKLKSDTETESDFYADDKFIYSQMPQDKSWVVVPTEESQVQLNYLEDMTNFPSILKDVASNPNDYKLEEDEKAYTISIKLEDSNKTKEILKRTGAKIFQDTQGTDMEAVNITKFSMVYKIDKKEFKTLEHSLDYLIDVDDAALGQKYTVTTIKNFQINSIDQKLDIKIPDEAIASKPQ